jgi:hypothetical protein
MMLATLAILSFLLPAGAIHLANIAIAAKKSSEYTPPTIPWQLVMTGKQGSVDELPPKVRDNVRQTIALNPDLPVRWLDDAACRDFLRANFGSSLLATFNSEPLGAYRGDICRAAVLALEGGIYMDLDVQMHVPFSQLVDNNTTFMASVTEYGDVMNALFAVERGSQIMQAVLHAIEDWYSETHSNPKKSGWMGPQTMLRGLEKVAALECPSVRLRSEQQLQLACGPHHQIRLYREQRLQCAPGSAECPPPRRSGFPGLRWGIFEPGPQRRLVAWSRFAACESWGCGYTGHEVERSGLLARVAPGRLLE